MVQVTEAVRQARDRRDFQQQLRQGREFTGGMLILLNIWRGIGKQSETAAPRAGIYWLYVDSFEYLARESKQSETAAPRAEFTGYMLILLNIWRGIGKQPETAAPRAGIYWPYVDYFAHFGRGIGKLSNYRDHLGGEFSIDTNCVLGERLAQSQQKHRTSTALAI